MKSVLIVDDSRFMRMNLRTMIEKKGFHVVGEAENGAIAVEKYRQLNPDIVTMDISMPEVDGFTALRRIREINGTANVIMVSAMGQEAIVRDSIMYGAKNFIVKPFTEERVIKALSEI